MKNRKYIDLNLRLSLRNAVGKLIISIVIMMLSLVQSVYAYQQDPKALMLDSALGQAVFASPELAAQTLAVAVADKDVNILKQIFGAQTEVLLPATKINQATIDTFLEEFARKHTFLTEGSRRYALEIGDEGWIFPVPIQLGEHGWYFDSEEGVERVRIRRIGKNELSVMQALLAYYDAQLEYAEQDRDGDGVLEYAQKLLSSEGMQDGLYWQTPPETTPSPLGSLFSNVEPKTAYFGYRYQILDSQGEHAAGGSLSYIEGENMTRGFALLARPVDYGNTGVMTFTVNQEGLVFSQDLGPETSELVNSITSYDPGPNWSQEVGIQP